MWPNMSMRRLSRKMNTLYSFSQRASNVERRCFTSVISKMNSSTTHSVGSRICIAKSPFYNTIKPIGVRWWSSTGFPEHEVLGMPALSPTMEAGSIAKWVLKEGQRISVGDIICEIETDKATVDYEAQDEGYLAKILVPAGKADVGVGQPIMILVEDEASVNAFANYSVDESTNEASESTEKLRQDKNVVSPPKSSSFEPRSSSPTLQNSPTSPVHDGASRVFASPLARKMARENEITINSIRGTGPLGRIIGADVAEALAKNAVGLSQKTLKAQDSGSSDGSYSIEKSIPAGSQDFEAFSLSQHSREIAQNLAQQKREVPHYHLSTDISLDRLLKVREQLNEERKENEKISVNDFFIRASSLAMQHVPQVNSSWKDTFIRQYHNTNISLNISVNGELINPVIQNVNQKGLHQISKDTQSILDRANNENLSFSDFSNGTFTIANVGLYGVKSVSPIVSPNQSCTLGLGVIEKRIVPNEDPNAEAIYKSSYMTTVTLACDHRVVDGAVGAQWLSAFKTLLENPLNMLL